LRGVLVRGAGVAGKHGYDDGGDDADHDDRDGQSETATSPVNLRRQWAMRFKIQHVVTVSPGHREPSDVARRVAGWWRLTTPQLHRRCRATPRVRPRGDR